MVLNPMRKVPEFASAPPRPVLVSPAYEVPPTATLKPNVLFSTFNPDWLNSAPPAALPADGGRVPLTIPFPPRASFATNAQFVIPTWLKFNDNAPPCASPPFATMLRKVNPSLPTALLVAKRQSRRITGPPL